jgi:phospholipase/carboxylesterase
MTDRVQHHEHEFRQRLPYTVQLPPGYDPERRWPVVMALHGMGQSEDHMRRFLRGLEDSPYIWCFPRGVHPYEIRKPERTRIGHAWYLFTGDQDALRESMHLTGQCLLDLHDALAREYPVGGSAVVGFSQGGYLAGVVAAGNPGRFKGAACIGGRLKHEFMPEGGGVRLLQLHGGNDRSVPPELAQEAVTATRRKGYEVEYHVDEQAGHEVSPGMVEHLGRWLGDVL